MPWEPLPRRLWPVPPRRHRQYRRTGPSWTAVSVSAWTERARSREQRRQSCPSYRIGGYRYATGGARRARFQTSPSTSPSSCSPSVTRSGAPTRPHPSASSVRLPRSTPTIWRIRPPTSTAPAAAAAETMVAATVVGVAGVMAATVREAVLAGITTVTQATVAGVVGTGAKWARCTAAREEQTTAGLLGENRAARTPVGAWLLQRRPTFRPLGGGGSWVPYRDVKVIQPLKRQAPSLIDVASSTGRLKKKAIFADIPQLLSSPLAHERQAAINEAAARAHAKHIDTASENTSLLTRTRWRASHPCPPQTLTRLSPHNN